MVKRPKTGTASAYGLMIGLKGKGKRSATQIWPKELTRFEVAAIGIMTVQWGYLEHMLLITTVELADEANLPMPDDAAATSFERRIDAFRSTIKQALRDSPRRRRLLSLATRISNIHNDRNMVTHGLWEWYPGKPTKLRLYTFRPPFKFDTNFDIDRLRTLCNRLGEINHELTHPPRSGLRTVRPSASYVSRDAAISLSEKDPAKFGVRF